VSKSSVVMISVDARSVVLLIVIMLIVIVLIAILPSVDILTIIQLSDALSLC
jgi:hypothetical protein